MKLPTTSIQSMRDQRRFHFHTVNTRKPAILEDDLASRIASGDTWTWVIVHSATSNTTPDARGMVLIEPCSNDTFNVVHYPHADCGANNDLTHTTARMLHKLGVGRSGDDVFESLKYFSKILVSLTAESPAIEPVD